MAPSLIFLSFAAFFAALGQVFLKLFVGRAQFTLTGMSFRAAISFALNPFFIGALAVYGVSLVLYVQALKDAHLDFAYPLFLGFSVILIFALSALLLKDPVNAFRISGAAIVLFGTYLMWLSR